MKRFTIISLLLIAFSLCKLMAQEKQADNKFAIKIYTNGLYSKIKTTENRDYVYDITYEEKKFSYGGISFALELLNDNFFTHEFEIMPINFNYDYNYLLLTYAGLPDQLTKGEKVTTIESAIRYQANHYFSKNRLVNPYIGLSTRLFYTLNNSKPLVSGYYPIREQNIGVQMAVSPGVEFKFSNKLGLNLDIPVNLYQLRLNMVYEQNPAIPVKDQKNREILGDFFPEIYTFRVAFIYKI